MDCCNSVGFSWLSRLLPFDEVSNPKGLTKKAKRSKDNDKILNLG